MERGRFVRYGALSGIVAVILIIVGFSIFASDIPDADDAAQKWQTFFLDHQDRVQTGMTLISIGGLFFLWFLGSLREGIAAVEGGARLASIAFGGGLVAVSVLSAGRPPSWPRRSTRRATTRTCCGHWPTSAPSRGCRQQLGSRR